MISGSTVLLGNGLSNEGACQPFATEGHGWRLLELLGLLLQNPLLAT